ncbi:sliding clamp [Morganella phage vB_Mm5]
MKFSTETINILKNFSQINPSIVLKRGSIINTKSINSVIYAEATVPDVIDCEVGIYEISSFLNILNLVGTDAEISFDPQTMLIHIEGNGLRITHEAQDQSAIAVPKNRISLNSDDAEVHITLTQERFDQLMKACRMMNLKLITVKGESGKIKLIASNPSDMDMKNAFIVDIAETDLPDFTYNINFDNMKMPSSAYELYFYSRCVKIESDKSMYVVALEAV